MLPHLLRPLSATRHDGPPLFARLFDRSEAFGPSGDLSSAKRAAPVLLMELTPIGVGLEVESGAFRECHLERRVTEAAARTRRHLRGDGEARHRRAQGK